MAQAELRADARRNVEKLKAAAVEVFREKGLHAPLEEITKRAGVSKGTVYHRFGSREGLIDAVMPDLAIAALGEAAERALACEDPWEGFAGYVEDVSRIQASDPALNDVISRRYAAEQLAVVCRVAEEREREIIERAQRAGALRADFTREDMLFVFWSTAMLVRHTADTAPDAWRRSIGFLLDGLRAEAARPLPVRPLTRDQVDDVMRRLGESGPL
ncbi:AcrR family transcriptional regulator [Thermocatellispora tengchongensis]|uniref:AcrR family transcriptional regulator n=1 Tax=Thermocatellispora tengchongensis TaxID=1073253 RepID=A0A840PLK9_9ACTN|nr:TetR/AcrR family transcriptional regulator [Thermocatellispora tengchongensis]MBB5136935.1 AcrR family transcriptional regulator [Thermocatellispora tengchongensis]